MELLQAYLVFAAIGVIVLPVACVWVVLCARARGRSRPKDEDRWLV